MEIKIGYKDETKEISGAENLQHRFVLSSDAIDRDFEQVLVSGIQLKNFKQNPVMYFMHKTYEGIPIGMWTDITKEKRGEKNYLLATTDYNTDNEDAMQVAKFVESGYMRMASIGFLALSIDRVDPPEEYEEVLKRWTMDGKMTVFKKIELTEASIVGIGSNPDALKEKISKGLMKNISELDLIWLKEKTFDPHREFIFLNHKILSKDFQPKLFDEPDLIIPEKKILIPKHQKQGAVLSKKNKAKLQSISDLAKEILDDAEPEPEPVNYLNSTENETKINTATITDNPNGTDIKIYDEKELYSILNN